MGYGGAMALGGTLGGALGAGTSLYRQRNNEGPTDWGQVAGSAGVGAGIGVGVGAGARYFAGRSGGPAAPTARAAIHPLAQAANEASRAEDEALAAVQKAMDNHFANPSPETEATWNRLGQAYGDQQLRARAAQAAWHQHYQSTPAGQGLE